MNFDYLIIGAGSAGCVLANRLTENDQNNVAIFEAGKPSDIWKVNMPLAILYTMHDPKYNYKYYSEIGRACVGKECRSRWSPYH